MGVGEANPSGSELRAYGYVPNSAWTTNPLFQKIGGNYYWYQNDHQETPQKIVDTSGAVVWAATYDSFGNAQITVSAIENNLRFAGQYFDAESGLHYNLHRYYDPKTGRYLQTDPLHDGLNPYVYAFGNPVNLIDPEGTHVLLGIGKGALKIGIAVGIGVGISILCPPLAPVVLVAGTALAIVGSFQLGFETGNLIMEAFSGETLCDEWYERVGEAAVGWAGLGLGRWAEIKGWRPFGKGTKAGGANTGEAITSENNLPSTLRQTTPGETFIRYESGNPESTHVTKGGGLDPGTFAASKSEGVRPQSELPSRYKLPKPETPRTVYYEVNPPAGTWVEGPRPVAGGSGSEVRFPYGVPPGSVGPPNPVPEF